MAVAEVKGWQQEVTVTALSWEPAGVRGRSASSALRVPSVPRPGRLLYAAVQVTGHQCG